MDCFASLALMPLPNFAIEAAARRPSSLRIDRAEARDERTAGWFVMAIEPAAEV
jgi:hypothetical protein